MKAKDIRGKNIEDLEDVNKAEKPEEEDAVAAAYENISKRLESLRGEKEEESGDESRESIDKEDGSQDENEDEVELTEWKGPRKPTKEDLVERDEKTDMEELRKVKLKNLEDVEKEEEIDPLDDDGEDQEEEEKESKAESREFEDIERKDSGKSAKNWEPDEGDPLDEEEEEKVSKAESREYSEESGDDEAEDDSKAGVFSDNLENPKREETALSEESDLPGDIDKTEADLPTRQDFSEAKEEENLSRNQEPDSLDDLTEDKPRTISQMATEDDYFIPNLKGSRQREVDMSYNAHPQTGSVGDSYAPRQNHMEGNDPNSFFSQHQPQPPKRANKFHLLILVIIGIAVIGFTVYILKGGFGDINLGSAPSPSPSSVAEATPTPTPTPTPAPEVDRSEFTVRVLNGTTTSGLARTVSDSLEELGYETVNPGNASANDVEQTEIRVKEGSESASLFEALKADLAADYEAIQGDDLSKSASYDAEVIIGAK